MKVSAAFKIKSLWAVVANYMNFKHLFLDYLLISKKLVFEIGSCFLAQGKGRLQEMKQ